MGFSTVLTIVFVILKLVNVITWSWWLVLLPKIIDIAISILVVLCEIYRNI